MKSKKENKAIVEKRSAKTNAAGKKISPKVKAADKKKSISKKASDPDAKARVKTKESTTGRAQKETKSTNTKAEKKTKPAAEKKEKPKKFFPEKAAVNILPTGAIPPKSPTTKRSAWTKKPIENPHSTPAGPCINLRDVFDSYVAKKYKRLKDDQRKEVWQQVAMRLLSEPSSRLTEITDEILSKK